MSYPAKEQMIAYYEDLLGRYGDSFRTLDWKSAESQKLRYAVLLYIFYLTQRLKDISILDVGCGLGHFYGYLKEEDLIARDRIDYTGYDISAKLIERAQKLYPEAKFLMKDILEEEAQSFDYVFCSGVFNIILTDEGTHLKFVNEMLCRMFAFSKIGLAVNFLSITGIHLVPERASTELSRYYYFKPEEIALWARALTDRFILRHDYHPGDFTLYLLK